MRDDLFTAVGYEVPHKGLLAGRSCCFRWLAGLWPCSMTARIVTVGVGRRPLVATGMFSGHMLPSVDPAIERAATDIVSDPDAYFERQRMWCELEAEKYVKSELALSMLRRRSSRPTVRKFLARLSSG